MSDELKQVLDGTIHLALKKILTKAKRGQPLSASDTRFLKEMRDVVARSGEDERDWEEEYRKYKALLAQIKYEQEKAILIPREKVTAAWRNRYSHIRRNLLLWSKRLPGRLVGLSEREMIEVIDDEVRFLLSLLARPGKFTKLEEQDGQREETNERDPGDIG